MSSRPKNPKYARNKNILVIGGSGSGKTRFFVKPSLMQMHSSYVVTDPKGQLLSEVGTMLRRGAPKLDENGKPMRDARGKVIYEPYRIKVLNTINFKKSMKYNPFAYIRSEKDILKLVNVIIANTKGDGEKSSEDFWVKAERLLYCALIGYIWYEAGPEEKNFLTLLELINASEAREDDEEFQSPVDLLFAKLEKEHPDHFAVKQYRKFKLAAGKTAKSILVSAAVRLATFNIPQYARMTMVDEMDFGSLGEKKKAIFCVIPVDDSSMNYLVGMLYTQCFQALYRRADEKHNGRLPVPVRVIQDEWANVAQPESYPKILATCRSYNIGLNIIVQNIQQIKALYEKEWESIIGNCDTLLFLGGGNEPTSLEFIVKLLGKETIATRTRGQTKGRSGSSSTNFQQTGRDLMTIDEVRKLDTHKAILFIRGEDPVLDKKYNIKRHPNIKLTTDGKAKPYIHKPLGAPDYALPDLPYAFKSLDDYDFIDVEEPEHELSEKEKDFKPDKTE